MYPDPIVVQSECLERQRLAIHYQLGTPNGIGLQTRHELLTGGTLLHARVLHDSLIAALRRFVKLATRGGRGHMVPTSSSPLNVPSVGAGPRGR
jgi:hypothetical protein